MIDERDLFVIVDSMASANEIIPKPTKIKALNVMQNKLKSVQDKTHDALLTSSIASALMVIEDAYKIDMYRFQFKLLSDIMNKEIRNFEELLEIELST